MIDFCYCHYFLNVLIKGKLCHTYFKQRSCYIIDNYIYFCSFIYSTHIQIETYICKADSEIVWSLFIWLNLGVVENICVHIIIFLLTPLICVFFYIKCLRVVLAWQFWKSLVATLFRLVLDKTHEFQLSTLKKKSTENMA